MYPVYETCKRQVLIMCYVNGLNHAVEKGQKKRKRYINKLGVERGGND